MVWTVDNINRDGRDSVGNVTQGYGGVQAAGKLGLAVIFVESTNSSTTQVVASASESVYGMTELLNIAVPNTYSRLIVLGRILTGAESLNLTISVSVSAGTIKGYNSDVFVISGSHQTLASIITAYATAGERAAGAWAGVSGPTPAIDRNGSMALFAGFATDGISNDPTTIGTYAPPNNGINSSGLGHTMEEGYDLGPLSIGTVTAYGATGTPAGASGFGDRGLVVLVLRAPNNAPSAPASYTAPTNGSIVRVNRPVTVTVTAATDTDGGTLTYTHEVSFNGGGYSSFGGTGLSTTYTPTVPGTYAFRHKATDPEGTSGSYLTGATITAKASGASMVV